MEAINAILNVPWAGDEFKFAAIYRVASVSHIGYEILYSDKQPWFNRNFGIYVTNGTSNDVRVKLPDTAVDIEDWQNTVVTIEKWKAVNEKPAPVQAKLILQIADGATGTDISHFSEQQRANIWIVKGSRGSSECIWAHMMGIEVAGSSGNYPRDTGDFNRCLLLLEAVPEWKPRMKEMASHGRIWAAMAESWEEITQAFVEEVGINWSNGGEAKKAYQLIKKARGLDVDG